MNSTFAPTFAPSLTPSFSTFNNITNYPSSMPTKTPSIIKNNDIEIIRLPTYRENDPVDVLFLVACLLLSVGLTFYMIFEACKKNKVEDIALHTIRDDDGDAI